MEKMRISSIIRNWQKRSSSLPHSISGKRLCERKNKTVPICPDLIYCEKEKTLLNGENSVLNTFLRRMRKAEVDRVKDEIGKQPIPKLLSLYSSHIPIGAYYGGKLSKAYGICLCLQSSIFILRSNNMCRDSDRWKRKNEGGSRGI